MLMEISSLAQSLPTFKPEWCDFTSQRRHIQSVLKCNLCTYNDEDNRFTEVDAAHACTPGGTIYMLVWYTVLGSDGNGKYRGLMHRYAMVSPEGRYCNVTGRIHDRYYYPAPSMFLFNDSDRAEIETFLTLHAGEL